MIKKWVLLSPTTYIAISGVLIIWDMYINKPIFGGKMFGLLSYIAFVILCIVMPIMGYIWEHKYERQ